jgi:hypothetical protein
MEQQPDQRSIHAHEEPPAAASAAENKQSWQEPKLTFVEPKLTDHGTVQEVTGQFFDTFPPRQNP